MAKKTIKARRKQVRRRNTTKSVFPKLLIGAGVIGGGYLLWKKVIKPYMTASQDSTQELTGAVAPIDQQIQNVIGSAQATPVNVPSAGAGQTFNPIGTPWNKLNKTTPIKYGSKGEEVKMMQTFINASYKELGKPTRVAMDGIFGPQTWNVVKNISFQAQPLTFWAELYNNIRDENLDFTPWDNSTSGSSGSSVNTSGTAFNIGSGYGGQF